MKPEQALELGEEVSRAVLAHYLDTGDAADAWDLAKRLGWSEAKVRRVINANFGAVKGTDAVRASRPKYAKYSVVWCYRPQLNVLRKIILKNGRTT